MLGRIRAVRHSSSRIYAHFALSADLSTASREGQADVAIVGAGHNGLVAATLLARQGLKVFEEKDMVGGACRTEYPFKRAPGLAASTGAYLLGVMPPELIQDCRWQGFAPLQAVDLIAGLSARAVPLAAGDRYLLFGSDQQHMKAQFLKFFSTADWEANQRLQAEMAQLVQDIGPTWLQAPLSLEDTAERHVRPQLRETFINLCQQPVARYLDRFGFKSDLLKAMYAVTDGFAGLTGSWESPGSGMNFLVHNMCRLPGSDGTWMVVRGGMGTITQRLAQAAMQAGANIQTGQGVQSISIRDGVAHGVQLADGREVAAQAVVVNADPFRLRELAGKQSFSAAFNKQVDDMLKDGTSLKINLALKGLPKFKCLQEDKGQLRTTVHLLPDEERVLRSITDSFEDVKAGRLPDFPTMEWYIHTTVDPSLQDKEGHHNSALFVQWVPHDIEGSTWELEEDRYVHHLLKQCERFAPGTLDLVQDTFTLTPPKIAKHFGISRGHIHHGLIKAFDPVITWAARRYQLAVGTELKKYGLRYEDLYDPLLNQDVDEALRRLPVEVTDARNQRMKRAVDCSLKKSYLPKDLQDQQTPWAWYVRDQDGVHAGISHRVLSGKLAGCKLLLLGADARRSGRSILHSTVPSAQDISSAQDLRFLLCAQW
eukprot:jgi/Astpho2/992/fgenesh1_pg.00016_%23_155_t